MSTEISNCVILLADSYNVYLIAGFLIGNEALEYWLGKTTKTKSGSKIELALMLIKLITKGMKK